MSVHHTQRTSADEPVPLRYSTRSEGHHRFARERWFAVDNQTGLDASGPRQSEQSARDEADRLNGRLLREEHEARRSA